MFVAWALLAGLGGSIHTDECPEDLEALKTRSITPGAFFMQFCDGKFIDEDLNAEGNAFAAQYFRFEGGGYLEDYTNSFPDDLPSLYHVPDTWETFEVLKVILDKRLEQWRAGA